MFQIAQATVNNARGAAGGASGEIVLFQQKGVASGAGTLTGDRNAIDPAADDDHVEMFSAQWPPDWRSKLHGRECLPERSHMILRQFVDR